MRDLVAFLGVIGIFLIGLWMFVSVLVLILIPLVGVLVGALTSF